MSDFGDYPDYFLYHKYNFVEKSPRKTKKKTCRKYFYYSAEHLRIITKNNFIFKVFLSSLIILMIFKYYKFHHTFTEP